MNNLFRFVIPGLLALASQVAGKFNFVITPELATWLSIILTAIAGIAANGVKIGFRDVPTTVSGVVGALAILLASFGLELGPETQAALIGIALSVIGYFIKSDSSKVE